MIIGLIIMMGALLKGAFLGFEPRTIIFFVLGLVILIGSWFIKKRAPIISFEKKAIFTLLLMSIVVLVIFLGPLFTSGQSPLEELNAGLKKSAQLLEANKVEQATKKLEALLKKYPDEARLYLNLSTAYLLQQKPLEAQALLDNKTKPLDGQAMFNYAMAFYQKEQYADASLYLLQSLLQKPDEQMTWIYASESALREKDLKGATYFAAVAVEKWPDQPELRYQLAKIKLESMHFQEAAEHLNQALKLNPSKSFKVELLKLLEDAEYYQKRTEHS